MKHVHIFKKHTWRENCQAGKAEESEEKCITAHLLQIFAGVERCFFLPEVFFCWAEFDDLPASRAAFIGEWKEHSRHHIPRIFFAGSYITWVLPATTINIEFLIHNNNFIFVHCHVRSGKLKDRCNVMKTHVRVCKWELFLAVWGFCDRFFTFLAALLTVSVGNSSTGHAMYCNGNLMVEGTGWEQRWRVYF